MKVQVFIGFLLSFAVGFAGPAFAQSKAPAHPKHHKFHAPPPFDQEHKDLTDVLQQAVVVNGSVSKVRYKWLVTHQTKLILYLKDMAHVAPKTYNSWSDNDKMAFLINAYNAFTIKLVVDNYPIQSIKKIGGIFKFLKSPWKIDFITLLWKRMSLDDIEHMLRTDFNDPRVHFAINCASIGCPAIRNEAYVGSRLDSQLDEQARLFLRDGVRNQIDVNNKTLKLSKIFDWYADDFTKKAGSVEKFIAPYITDDPAIRKSLMNNEYKITYTDYDWSLNDAKK